MWFAYLYRRAPDASTWVPDPDEVAAAATEDACITALLVPPFDERYELGVDALPPYVPDIRGELLQPVPRLFARVDTDDHTGQTYDYVSVVEDADAPAPQPPNPLPRVPLADHSVAAVHLVPDVGTPGQLLVLDATQELTWQDPGTIALDDGSVTTAKLADDAVQTAKVLDGAITGAKMAPATITADKLAEGVIPAPPGAASDTTPGLIQLASTAEVLAGTETTKAVTPGRLVGRTATETRTGLVELATTAEAVTGTDTQRAVTPAGLEARVSAIPALPNASEATSGLVRLATQAEVGAGTDDTRAVTPLKLAQRLVAASTTALGLIELATQSEVTTGTDATRAVTPATLASELLARLVAASETVAGLVELATQGEVTTGTDNTRAVTPLKLQQRLTAVLPPAASETVAGIVELATSAETTTGTDATRAVTPAGLAAKVPSGTALSVARYAASGQALEASALTVDATNRLGVGTPSPAAPLHVLNSAAELRLERSAGAGHTTTLSDLSTGLELRKVGTTASTFLDFNITNDGTQSAIIRLFRSTTTTGVRALYFYQGDGAGTLNHTIEMGGGPSSFQRNGGNFGIGTTLLTTLGSGASFQQLSVKGSQLLVGQSSVQERAQALLAPSWVVSTDATRTARLTLSVYDATAAREGLRIEASGTAPMIGFLGANAVVRQTVPAAATDAATTQTLVNSLRTALVNLGLCV